MAATVLAATGMGLVASIAGIPLPWLIGPLVICGVLSMFGVDLAPPRMGRQIGQVVVGVVIGLTFTNQVALKLITYADLMIGAALLAMIGGALIAFAVTTFTGVPYRTTYFASVPGGVAEMSEMAERAGGHPGMVALAQSTRIVFVVTLIAPFVALSSGPVVGGSVSFLAVTDMMGVMFLLICATALAKVFSKLRVSNAWLLGGIVAGATTALLSLPISSVPPEVLRAAQVLIGCALGARFHRSVLLDLRKFIPAMLVATIILIAITTLISAVLTYIGELSFYTLLLGTAPGGVSEMSITAQLFGYGVATIAAFHMVRIVLVILFTGPIFRIVDKLTSSRFIPSTIHDKEGT